MNAATTAWVDRAVPDGADGRDPGRRRAGRDARRAPADGVLQRLDRAGLRPRLRLRADARLDAGARRGWRARRRRHGPDRRSLDRRPEGPRARRRRPRRGDGRRACASGASGCRCASSRAPRESLARGSRGRARPTSRARDAAPLVLVVAALVVFAIQSLGWPVAPGRDLAAYLVVYVDFWHGDPVLPWTMVNRTPVAPLVVGGILDLGSPVLVVAFAALLFAGTVLLYARTALRFGRGPAVLVSVALLLFPGFGIVFHELSGDVVFAAAFAVWTAIAVEAALRPGVWRFALLGAATAFLALIRPANQAFLVVGLLPLLLAAPWRVRLVAGGRVRRGRRRPARGVVDGQPRPLRRLHRRAGRERQPAALPRVHRRPHRRPRERAGVAELAAAVERDLLGEEPYRSYGIDLADVLRRGKPADARGPDQPLRPRLGVGLGLRPPRRGGVGGRSCAPVDVRPRRARRLLGGAVAAALRRSEGARRRRGDRRRRGPAPGVGLRRAPEPTEGEPIPSEHQSAQLSTPDQSIREVWTSATEHHVVFDDPAKAAQQAVERPTARRALRRVPRPLVEPVARPPDGPLVEALPAALAVAPRRRDRRRLAAPAALVGDAHAGPRRSRDAPRDRDGRLGRAGLRRARRPRVRAARRRGPARRPEGAERRGGEHDEQREQHAVPHAAGRPSPARRARSRSRGRARGTRRWVRTSATARSALARRPRRPATSGTSGTSQSTNCGDSTRPSATWAATTAAQSRTSRAGSASLRHAATQIATTTATASEAAERADDRPERRPSRRRSARRPSRPRRRRCRARRARARRPTRPSASTTLPGRLSTWSPRVSCARIENHASPGASARNGRTTSATVAGRDPDDGRGCAPAGPPERDDRDERQQEERVELRGDREPERDRGESRPAGEERGDRAPPSARRGARRTASARARRGGAASRRRGRARARHGRPSRGAPQSDSAVQDDRRGEEQGHERRERRARSRAPRRSARARRRASPSARETSEGSRKAGSAPGGYSTRKSRYGTSPSVIRSPNDW